MTKLYQHFKRAINTLGLFKRIPEILKSKGLTLLVSSLFCLAYIAPQKSIAQPADPASLLATPTSDVQIDLSVTDNGIPDNIVVIFNLTGTFTAPTDGSAPTAVGTTLTGSGGT